MLLGFLVQRLICNAVVAVEFSWLLNEFTVKTWFPWLTEVEKSDWFFIDGPQELGYQLIPTGVAQQDSELYPALTLAEYRNLLQMRNWGLEPEGEDAVVSNPVLSWVN